jgi:hypothetical protein
MPGVNPLDLNTALQIVYSAPTLGSVTVGSTATLTTGAPELSSEPAVACYAFATCTGAAAPALRIAYRAPRIRPSVVHLHVDVLEGYQLQPVQGVRVTVAGHTKRTNAAGNVSFSVRALHKHSYRITASLSGCNSATKRLVL